MLEVHFCKDCGSRMLHPLTSRALPNSGDPSLPATQFATFFRCGTPGCYYFVVRSDFQRPGGRYQRGIEMEIRAIGNPNIPGAYEIEETIQRVLKTFRPVTGPAPTLPKSKVDRAAILGDWAWNKGHV